MNSQHTNTHLTDAPAVTSLFAVIAVADCTKATAPLNYRSLILTRLVIFAGKQITKKTRPEQRKFMNQSESIGKLAEALAKAQSQIKGASKDAINPHFRSNYSTLSSILDACREPLTNNGLAVSQVFKTSERFTVLVETKLVHTSNEWITSELGFVLQQTTPQAIGSAISYARRYALAAICGVASIDEDDDAENATRPATPKHSPTPKPFNKDAKPSNRDEKEAWHETQKPPIRPATNPPQIVEKQTSQTDLTPKQETFIKSIETEFALLGINGKTKAGSIQKAKTLVGDAFDKAVADFHKFVRSRKISKILETAKTEEWDDATKITYFSGFGNGNLEQNDDSIINEIYADLKNSSMIKG